MPSSLPVGTLDRLLESIIARTPRAGAVAKAPAKRGLIEFPAPTRKVDVLKADPFNSRLRLSCPLPHPDRGGHLMWIMAIIHAEALADGDSVNLAGLVDQRFSHGRRGGKKRRKPLTPTTTRPRTAG